MLLLNEFQRLNAPQPPPAVVPLRRVIPTEIDAVMYPIEEEVLDILHKSTEKGSANKYLKERYKKAPEDKLVLSSHHVG